MQDGENANKLGPNKMYWRCVKRTSKFNYNLEKTEDKNIHIAINKIILQA